MKQSSYFYLFSGTVLRYTWEKHDKILDEKNQNQCNWKKRHRDMNFRPIDGRPLRFIVSCYFEVIRKGIYFCRMVGKVTNIWYKSNSRVYVSKTCFYVSKKVETNPRPFMWGEICFNTKHFKRKRFVVDLEQKVDQGSRGKQSKRISLLSFDLLNGCKEPTYVTLIENECTMQMVILILKFRKLQINPHPFSK